MAKQTLLNWLYSPVKTNIHKYPSVWAGGLALSGILLTRINFRYAEKSGSLMAFLGWEALIAISLGLGGYLLNKEISYKAHEECGEEISNNYSVRPKN